MVSLDDSAWTAQSVDEDSIEASRTVVTFEKLSALRANGDTDILKKSGIRRN